MERPGGPCSRSQEHLLNFSTFVVGLWGFRGCHGGSISGRSAVGGRRSAARGDLQSTRELTVLATVNKKNAEAFLCAQKEPAFSKVGRQGWANFKRSAGESLIL